MANIEHRPALRAWMTRAHEAEAEATRLRTCVGSREVELHAARQQLRGAVSDLLAFAQDVLDLPCEIGRRGDPLAAQQRRASELITTYRGQYDGEGGPVSTCPTRRRRHDARCECGEPFVSSEDGWRTCSRGHYERTPESHAEMEVASLRDQLRGAVEALEKIVAIEGDRSKHLSGGKYETIAALYAREALDRLGGQ